jgi:carbamoyltransferase
VQTVSFEDNALFWQLLRTFGELTGLPVLLNTSFNVQGQPIVRTADQAVRTFDSAGLDALAMGTMIITRRNDIDPE